MKMLTTDEANAICVALDALIYGLENGICATESPNLLENLKSALKKIRGEK